MRNTVLGVILMMAAAALVSPETTVAEFYGNPIALEFLAGLGVWRLYASRPCLVSARGMGWLATACLVGMATVELAGWHSPPQLRHSYSRTFIMGGFGALIVGAALYGHHAFEALGKRVRMTLVTLGDASYAIYLTHVFVVSAMAITVAKLMPEWLYIVIGAVASLLVGICVHIWVDQPVQLLLKRIMDSASGRKKGKL